MRLTSDIVVKRLFCFRHFMVGTQLNQTVEAGGNRDTQNALFAVLVILGIVVDPTTEGVHDSKRAMSYEEPWSDAEIKNE